MAEPYRYALVEHNRYARDFAFITLEPLIRCLNRPGTDYLIDSDVPVENLFRQLECWRYDYSELPRDNPVFGHDPGIPREAANDVYAAMDAAFQHVFPDLLGYDRGRAAVLMQDIISSVFCFDGEPETPGSKEKLIAFMKHILEAFTARTKTLALKTPVSAESAA